MEKKYPSHINQLLKDLSECHDPRIILDYYTRYLHYDKLLHSVYTELGYDSETKSFPSLPSSSKIIQSMYKVFSSIVLPLKRHNSDDSETSSDKGKSYIGLKVLSSRVKSILMKKRPRSYREVAEELVKDFNVIDKAEEKNIHRRVYDALNVSIAADMIGKEREGFCWKGPSQEEILAKKKAELQSLIVKYHSIKSLISRNLKKPKPAESINFPFILIAVDEADNKLMIESSNASSMIKLKFQKEVLMFNLNCFTPTSEAMNRLHQ